MSASPHRSRPSSGTQTPTSNTYLSYPVSRVWTGLYRRLTDPSSPTSSPSNNNMPPKSSSYTDLDGVFKPEKRTGSPFAPPPLTALSLTGVRSSTSASAQILTRMLAEEIRLLLPPRLQLATDWELAFSIEQDGVSLGTLYHKCEEVGGRRGGFVMVVKDGSGGIFGAFLTDPPHPSPHYYGTGECFLWRASILPAASILANLPPPPSADTTNLQRSTTVAAAKKSASTSAPIPSATQQPDLLTPDLSSRSQNGNGRASPGPTRSGATTPDRIRFKAFPYSGVNDYVMFCEQSYLSVGGGDGKYGLWLDSSLETGVSAQCMTFGNEALSEDGEKFDVMGVEVWSVGN